jgi:hypothetical protein
MRRILGVATLAVVALSIVLIGTASAAKPPASNNSCPTSGTKNLKPALNVGASYDEGVYSVERFGPAAQTSLVKYCVYADPAPTALDATAEGADGSFWTASKLAKNFSFSRAGGEKSNLALDGTEQEVGEATFGTEPTKNDIVLHISDQAQCAALYGGTSLTCFVLPGTEPGPVCDAAAASGDAANAAYNNIPKDAVDCGPPSHAFQATLTKEFGDEVELAFGGRLAKLTVLFNSYACEDSAQWNNQFCTTTVDGHFFTHEITAHIYDPNNLTTPLASATQTFEIPFRPSADLVKCVAPDPNDPQNLIPTGAFFNTVSQTCNFSKKTLLTFTNWDTSTLPILSGNVVWTVEYGTSTNGITPPDASSAQCTPNAGCPYDSLNVGTKTFAGSAYAGEYVDEYGAFINSTWSGIYCDNGLGGTATLRASTNSPAPCSNFGPFPGTPDEPTNPNYEKDAWLGYQPLGMIVLNQT